MSKLYTKLSFLIVFFLASFTLYAQQATIIKLEQLEALLGKKNDTTYIINFWATWCKPCVKELPIFFREESRLKNEKVSFIFISLDFKRDIDSRLNAYIKENKIQSTVYLIDEPDYDKWIDKVDQSWQGNIPATLIYNSFKNKRGFYAKDFEGEELTSILMQLR